MVGKVYRLRYRVDSVMQGRRRKDMVCSERGERNVVDVLINTCRRSVCSRGQGSSGI